MVFTLVGERLCVLLARRLEEPQRGMFALPGGFVGAEESPEQTAERKLREKTGVGSVHLEQLRTYAEPTATRAAGCPRSPTSRSCRPEELPGRAPAEREASWHPVDALPELALDHETDRRRRAVAAARPGGGEDLVRARRRRAAPGRFTLAQAQRLYEALRGEPIDAANFRRDVKATGLLVDTGEVHSDGPGRPGRVYRRL